MLTRSLLILFAALAASCGKQLDPQGQVVIHIDTDAPLPSEPGVVRDPAAPAPLFDRIRIDLLEPGSEVPCGTCSREFAVYEERVARGLSFGVMAPWTPGTVVRFRLFREAFLLAGEPLPRTVLEQRVRLPAPPEASVLEGSVFLSTQEVGRCSSAPCAASDLLEGPVAASRVGSWEGAKQRGCAENAGPEEVCVPGGAAWMGTLDSVGEDGFVDVPAPSLVVLSPFYMGRTEVTVGALRSWGQAGSTRIHARATPIGANEKLDYNQLYYSEDACAYPADANDASADALAANCFTYELASAYCASKGGALPTEAQLAFVSGARDSRTHVWGADSPTCDEAVFARANVKLGADSCSLPGVPWGVRPPGSGSRDVLVLSGGSIFDLAGNLSELARDAWNRASDGCFSQTLRVDPSCEQPVSGQPPHVVRGGSWASPAMALRSSHRRSQHDDFRTETDPSSPTHLGPLVGFRCVRPATPR